MTGEFDSSPPVSTLAKQPGTCLVPGCSRTPTRSSGRRHCFFHDPAVPADEKLSARQLGGRRGALTASEVVRLLDGASLESQEGRVQLRDRLVRLRLAGQIGTGVFRDVLAAVDSATKDRDQAKPAPAPLVVEVSRFSSDGQQEPESPEPAA
jgi:hypothetical protein